MNFFKTLFNDPQQITKAVTGDPFENKEQIQALHNGTLQCDVFRSQRKIDQTKGTTFVYETNFYKGSGMTNYPQLLVKKIKTCTHPSLPKIYSVIESSKVTITTEELYPIADKISEIRKTPDLLLWAVYNVARAIDYFHNRGLIHGNLCPSSLYVTKSLEVKVFGLEYLSEVNSIRNSAFENRVETDPQILDNVFLPPDLRNYSTNPRGVDAWGVAAIMCYLFGSQPSSKSVVANSPSIPVELVSFHKTINSTNHQNRQSISPILTLPLISQNRFISIVNALESFSSADTFTRDSFLKSLTSQYSVLPTSFKQHKILEVFLQVLTTSIDASIVDPAMRLAGELNQTDFDSDVLPTLKQLLQNGSPSVKSQLLASASHYISKVPENVVGGYLYPMLTASMKNDASGLMKDAAVKSLVCLAEKIPQKTMDGEVFRFLENALQDQESVVRINTVVCIGKIASRFGPEKKALIVAKAFERGMKEGSLEMKKAAVVMISQNRYTLVGGVVAIQVLPYLSLAMVEIDPVIRKAAQEAWEVLVVVVAEYSKTLDNPSYIPRYPKEGEDYGIMHSNVSKNVATDDWDSWAASFEKQTQSRQPQIAATSYNPNQRVPKAQPAPKKQTQPKPQTNNNWGFDFDSDLHSGQKKKGNVPSFI
ncbi:Protein kinase domain-containing protein [Entamoeba marina]